jgi:hypothetical protein
MGTQDARQRRAYMLRIKLTLRGSVLNGALSAGNEFFGARSAAHLEQFVELRRQGE